MRWRDRPGISIQSTKANVTHRYRKYTGEIWQTEEEEVIWPQRQIREWCRRKATSQGMLTAGSKNRRDKRKFSPRASRRTVNVSPWFQTSGLQKWDKRNFCSFKLPKFWYFVMAALENSYTGSKKKSHMIIWIDTGKAFDRKQHLFLIKTHSKLGIERTSST